MTPSPLHLDRLAIVGVGLMGGSIGLAAKARGLAREVVGIGRNAPRLEAARKMGVIDSACEISALEHADLVVVCTPVDRVAQDVRDVLHATDDSTLVTDAGSIKGAIIEGIPAGERARFVGAHPLAGSHRSGFEHGSADLYDGRLCVVTPSHDTPPAALDRVREFWRSLGMRVCEMTPADHDSSLARTSHLPHLAAAVVAANANLTELHLAAGGFRDTTRVAQGDPELWSAIFTLNAAAMQREIDRAIEQLGAIRQALTSNDRDTITAFLHTAQQRLAQFHEDAGPGQGD